jgi:beta-lactam-binding protein with PASTA domain
LGSYTNHNKTIKVPSFNGIKLAQLDEFVSDKNLRYLIIDSVYAPKSAHGIVIKQEPEVDAEVKAGRIIYLYVTSVMPPSIAMPKLIDRSLRQAAAMITSYGLKLGKTKFIPDQCSNCILNQEVKGKNIEPGTIVPKGTVIDLTVGKGLSDEEVNVPCFYGLTIREAMTKLAEVSLSIGSVTFDNPKDSLSAKVYKQLPVCGKKTSLKMGEAIDFYLTTEKSKIPKMRVDSIGNTKKNEEDFDN